MALQIPETVLEVIGSRDLDGDHLVLFTPDLSLNNSLKLMTDNMFNAHDVQEQMLNFLRQSDNGYGYYKDMFTNYSVAHDSEILELLTLMIADITPEHDSKLQTLFKLLDKKINNPINEGNKKVLIFSAFSDTAEYLYKNLVD